jgi:hypothetical protein
MTVLATETAQTNHQHGWFVPFRNWGRQRQWCLDSRNDPEIYIFWPVDLALLFYMIWSKHMF